MGTQVFIQKQETCKPEYTKIAAHSFSFSPTGIISLQKVPFFYGGYSIESGYATWSRDIYDYANDPLGPFIESTDVSAGIPLPINLIADDVVTISGTATFNNSNDIIRAGYDVFLALGVYHFDPTPNTSNQSFTFIPIEVFSFKGDTITFETSVKLKSNYDTHKTKFVVGFNILAECPDACSEPTLINANFSTLSYSLDIERPCAAVIDNFIIKNCCEPLITELVHIPGLKVGNFHVDDEGNCWEVIAESKDVTNFSRNFVDSYRSCADCQSINPCPQNIAIASCCVMGVEYVTGSLPGINIGDTFVDNHGLCWTAFEETSGPISEESITVVEEIVGSCPECIDAYPCPKIFSIVSCCARFREIIATTATIDVGDSFVDTNGICWVIEALKQDLPTNYNIIVDTVYTGALDANCELCTNDNPCPLEYYLTVRACCDTDRTEVVLVPAQYMVFTEGLIFSDEYGVCWEVMSYTTTGTVTYPINFNFGNKLGLYNSCEECVKKATESTRTPALGFIDGPVQAFGCLSLYQVKDCQSNEIYTAQSMVNLTLGSFYYGIWTDGSIGTQSCYEVLGYGYPQSDPLQVIIRLSKAAEFEFITCQDCLLGSYVSKNLELQPCCGGGNINISFDGAWTNGIGSVQSVNVYDEFGSWLYTACFTLIGFSTGPLELGSADTDSDYSDCATCLIDYPC